MLIRFVLSINAEIFPLVLCRYQTGAIKSVTKVQKSVTRIK